MNNDDEERFFNMAVFNIYATNKERDEMFGSPAFWIMILVFIGFIIGGVYLLK